MVHICVHGCSMDVLVTVPSMDTGMWEKVDVHSYIYILYAMCPTMNYVQADTSSAMYVLHIGTVGSVQCM